jgi:hypothetical protein
MMTTKKMKDRPECEVCHKQIYNPSSCKVFKSGPPYYEEVYIHWNCINNMTKKEEVYDGGSEY